MVNELVDTFVVEAAGHVGDVRTESSVVTGGRVLSIIEDVTACRCPVLLGTRTLQDVMEE